MMTQHAEQRCQQRGIPPIAVMLYERYGSSMRHHGADVLFMNKQGWQSMARDFGGRRGLRAFEQWLDGYAVVENGRVITIAHRQHRLKRNVGRQRG